MKTLLLLITLVICFNLHITQKTSRHTYPDRTKTTGKPPPSPGERYKEALKSWFNPKPAFKKKITLTVAQYSHFTALAKFVPTGTKAQPTYVERFCKCRKPFGKRSLVTRVKRQDSDSPVLRREWRRMTPKMKTSFITHFKNLGKKKNGGKSKLRIFSDFHRETESPGAHRGPSFLPWHREFLFRLENDLRADGYEYGLPYWKSGYDDELINPEESAIFTPEELGTTKGKVVKPFGDIVSGACQNDFGTNQIVRNTTTESIEAGLMNSGTVADLKSNWNLNYKEFSKMLEDQHGSTHLWFGTGSFMNDFNCVGFEPMFYLHHAYVDYLWEQYRENQTEQDRENDYPSDLSRKTPFHKYRDMLPFDEMENIDGLKTTYTSVNYKYQKSPDECKRDKDCQSQMLWCKKVNQRKGVCKGKVKKGGACDRNFSETQCYCRTGTPDCPFANPPKCTCN